MVAWLEHRIRAAYPQAGRIYIEAQSLASHTAVRAAVMAGSGTGALVYPVPEIVSTQPSDNPWAIHGTHPLDAR